MSTSSRTSSAWPTGSSTPTRSPTASSGSASGASRCRRSPSWPTRRRSTRSRVGDADPQGADARNLWRVHWYNDLAGRRVDVPRPRRAAVVADRGREPDHRRVRRPLPDDHGPQGARRLRLPGAADRHRPVRPDPPPGDLAVDRQLRPRRHRHQPDHGQPRRGHPPRGHEPGALRLARPLVREPGRRRHPHAGHGVQRQGDLRRLQRAGRATRATSCSTSSASSATTSATTRSPAGRWSTSSTRSAPATGLRLAAFVVGHRFGGHDRRRRPAEGHVRHAASSPSRRWSARRCWRTGSASTTSRASATSTSR